MHIVYQEEGSYYVVLIGIETDTEEKRESFCKKISENYNNSFPLLKKIVAHCPIILKKNLSSEGTQFFSGENWRDLFHRAFSKLQQVANNILKRDGWNAIDLERLIRVIPYMGEKKCEGCLSLKPSAQNYIYTLIHPGKE